MVLSSFLKAWINNLVHVKPLEFGEHPTSSAGDNPERSLYFSILVQSKLCYTYYEVIGMEIWKNITGFDGWYQISSEGRFRAMPRTVIMKTKNGLDKPTRFKQRLLKVYVMQGRRSNIKPTAYVAFSVRGKHYRKDIHRLVAEAFLGPHKVTDEVNHIDGNRLNNRVENLEWISKKDNIRHAFKHHLIKTEKRVDMIDPVSHRILKTFRSESEACRSVGVSQGHVGRAIRRNGRCAGYNWEYTESKNV